MANRSTFPSKIDSFPELFDLPPSKVIQAKRFQELKAKPTLNALEQDELNALVVGLSEYIITPETWNKFADSLVNVQEFFTQEVMGYIEAKQSLWADYVKNFKYVEAYNVNSSYKFQNMVKFNGDLYLALKDNPKGTSITDTTKWMKISSKGDKGDIGLNVYYKGVYDTAKTYVVGDAVHYQDTLYYAKTSIGAGQNPTDASKWFLFEDVIVGKTAPIPQKGLYWMEELD